MAAGLLATSACLAMAAPGPMDFLYTSGSPPRADTAGAQPRVWKVAEFSALRLVAAEPGSVPGDHPVTLNAQRWRSLLAQVELLGEGDRRTPLFSADELAELAPLLARAMAQAGPGDDLLLLSTSRRGNLLSTPLSVTARLFVQAGQLNLIVHEARRDAYSEFRAVRLLPVFEFGSRSRASATRLVAETPAQARRPDWITWPLQAGAAVDPPAAPSAAAAPVVGSAPAVAASGAAPAKAPPRSRDAAFYAEQEERLRGLQRLRDAGLLSEEEYQQRRRVILDSL